MAKRREEEIFADYVRSKNLKHSNQRDIILKIFLKSQKHLTADEFYQAVKKASSGIGFATIYRTLKHFCESGLCRELKCEDGVTRYEHLYGHEHHDHLICTKCGKFVEVVDPDIEELQNQIAKKNKFVLTRHRLELYGLCRKCAG